MLPNRFERQLFLGCPQCAVNEGGGLRYAGNVGTGSTSFTVNVTYTSLSKLVSAFSTSTGVADALNSKLAAAEAAAARGQTATSQNILRAFTNQLDAQSGKAISAHHATLLANLAAQL